MNFQLTNTAEPPKRSGENFLLFSRTPFAGWRIFARRRDEEYGWRVCTTTPRELCPVPIQGTLDQVDALLQHPRLRRSSAIKEYRVIPLHDSFLADLRRQMQSPARALHVTEVYP